MLVSISPTFYVQLFVQNCFAQLFSTYSLTLKFFGKRLSAKKLFVKMLLKWNQGGSSSSATTARWNTQHLQCPLSQVTLTYMAHFHCGVFS